MVTGGRLLCMGMLFCCLSLLMACTPIQPVAVVSPTEPISPNQRWHAVLDPATGGLQLGLNDGEPISVFPAGSNVTGLSWSPDGTHLIALREGRSVDAQGQLVRAEEPTALWQIALSSTEASEPQLVFSTQLTEEYEEGIVFGDWSPDGRYLLFWTDPYYSASALADGTPLWMLDTDTATAHLVSGQPPLSKDSALLNPRYRSWSPDSSRLAITIGGYRSAQVNKWLVIHEPATQQSTVVISRSEQIPGIVAWSPAGNLIAYAAVPATETSRELADWSSWENPAIAGRRVYLLDPNNGKHWRLNAEDTFQDAPLWSEDGRTLYYVQRNGELLNLMAADPETGEATVVEGTAQPAGDSLGGYYGQSDFADLLEHRPEAPRAALPTLDGRYVDEAAGVTFQYPADWTLTHQGEASFPARPDLPMVSPAGVVDQTGRYPAADRFAPFSGQLALTIEITRPAAAGAILEKIRTEPGPGQLVGRDDLLATRVLSQTTLADHPAFRLQAVDTQGVLNQLWIVLGTHQIVILRGQGDGRLFDAIARTLEFTQP